MALFISHGVCAQWKAARESEQRSIAVTKAFSRTVYTIRKQQDEVEGGGLRPPQESKGSDDVEDYESAAGVSIRTQAHPQRRKGEATAPRFRKCCPGKAVWFCRRYFASDPIVLRLGGRSCTPSNDVEAATCR
jgi:hypothetical protein